MAHLFLIAPIATKLWMQFAIFAGIDIEDMNLKQLINTWWNIHSTPKLEAVYRAMLAFIMWIIWKRRNNIKHGGNVTLNNMIWKVQDMIRKLLKSLYPWMKIGKEDWPHMVNLLKKYKPRLHYYCVTWKFPARDRVKCNTDGACRGNLGMSALAFCVRDEFGDLIYATA
ncbi:hypothetical protein KY290_007767 [Solanum tuberosum]|uniref:RNase H family protein n=1 Tax=Solanum tuberosum TaxID=4113 RepID=A0ABQ7W7T6_SOLTU|nr:hypothetical protein KY290_007767 [Solanum tuberosum]